nr:uncharacterized protein LOC110134433 [Odocoileus virginianus texanus]
MERDSGQQTVGGRRESYDTGQEEGGALEGEGMDAEEYKEPGRSWAEILLLCRSGPAQHHGCTSQSIARVPVYLVLYVHHCAWPDVHHSAWPTALRCACALALVCIVVLWGPDEAVGEELQGQQRLMPRVARWLSNLGQFNKYMEKLFNSSMKSKKTKNSNDANNPKNSTKPLSANATKPLPANETKLPGRKTTNPPPRNAAKPQPSASSQGPR